MSVCLIAFICIEYCNKPNIKPAFCHRVSLQFLLVTSLCVIDCSVREWDVAVAMLTLGKICTADVTKEIQSSFAGAAVFCTDGFVRAHTGTRARVCVCVCAVFQRLLFMSMHSCGTDL